MIRRYHEMYWHDGNPVWFELFDCFHTIFNLTEDESQEICKGLSYDCRWDY